jgi:hypothetical protein
MFRIMDAERTAFAERADELVLTRPPDHEIGKGELQEQVWLHKGHPARTWGEH